MNEEILLDCIGNASSLKYSHSKLETFENCFIQYNLKYNEKKRTSDTSLALELGSLLHYILEQKGKMLLSESGIVDYEKLNKIMQKGVTEIDEKTKDELLGLDALKKKYFEEWYQADNASGMNYDDKMKIFEQVLHTEMEDDEEWKPYLFEHPFEFVWRDKYIISGFIDRIDINKNGELRCVDYKTSKKIFSDNKLPTSQQFGIYALAILNEFNKLPIESVYRFILLDDTQKALTKGWENRLIKKLDKIFADIEECEKTGIWKPSPSPLCYWCNFSETNPNATEHKYECPYHSLWTPNNKTFAVNRQFNTDDLKNNSNCSKLNTSNLNIKERKLIF